MKTPIFTIETFCNVGIIYYFDLLSNLEFGVHFHEKLVFHSKDPNDCIKYLKSKGCMCSENYDYSYLIKQPIQ